VSNTITLWRQAVMAQLEANLQDGEFTVLPGERDGLSRDRKLACVYAPALATDGANVSFARPVLIVRAWVPQPRISAKLKDVPADPEPVEQLMVDLAACLQEIQAQPAIGISGLYFFVTQIRPDYDDWGVEATLQGWTGNPAVLPAP
jgi:hypothetical protein